MKNLLRHRLQIEVRRAPGDLLLEVAHPNHPDETPVARDTSVIPPRPRAFASVAHHNRQLRSFRAGAIALNFVRSVRTSTLFYIGQLRNSCSYFFTLPKHPLQLPRA
jgi:hypothetical protein